MKIAWLCLVLFFALFANAKSVIHGSDRAMPIADHDYKKAKTITNYLPEIVDLPISEIDFKVMPWKRVMKQAELGHIDIVGPMGKDPRKESFFIFTEPIMTRDMLLWYKKSNIVVKKATWNQFADLKPFTIAYVLGYYYGAEFENFLKQSDVKKIEVVDVPHGIKVLEAGDADLFVASQIIMDENIDKAGLKHESFGHLPKSVVTIPFVLGISKKSPWAARVEELNKRIIKMRK